MVKVEAREVIPGTVLSPLPLLQLQQPLDAFPLTLNCQFQLSRRIMCAERLMNADDDAGPGPRRSIPNPVAFSRGRYRRNYSLIRCRCSVENSLV